jgi:parallel beta-helix repeat protein
VGVNVVATTGVYVQNNFIGTNAAGDAAVANGAEGVKLTTAASPMVRFNLVSGNTNDGISGTAVTNATFNMNYVGLNAAGSGSIPNAGSGMVLTSASHDNSIGGSTTNTGNFISGNTGAGIILGKGVGDQSTTKDNTIQGNYIGTNVAGDAALGNGTYGVLLQNGVTTNTVGGNVGVASCSAACNLISGNTTADIRMESGVTANAVKGNVVGLNLAATQPIRWNNEATGISIAGGAYSNTIGGTRNASVAEIGEGNVVGGYISDADHDGSYIGVGISLEADAYDVGSSTGNSIFGNLIGLNYSGSTTDAYTNTTGASGADNINDLRSRNGINVLAPYTVIGDGATNHFNAISGNAVGVNLRASSGISNVSINGNYIGTDKTGEIAQKSGGYTENTSYKLNFGIWASGTDHLTVRDNVLSGFQQVTVEGSKNAVGMALFMGYPSVSSPDGDNTNATIAGNKIGTDKDGASSIGNYVGFVCEQLSDSTIGGVGASDRNIISGNGTNATGVSFGTIIIGEESGCHDLLIKNNYFGTNTAGTSPLENNVGLELQKSAHNLVFDSNLFGEKSYVTLKSAQEIQFNNNIFGVGTDGTTRFAGGGNADLSFLQSSNVTVSANQFGFTSGKGITIDSSSVVTVDGNFVGTNSAKTATYGMLGGISVIGGSGVDVTNNTLRNIGDPPLDKYLVANSEFSYGGNDYTETWASNGFSACSPGVLGMNTLYYSSGLGSVYTGNICGQTQAFTGITHVSGLDTYLSDVKAYLISKSGHYYTVLVSQTSGGPFTCSFIASNSFGGGTCDKEFTVFTLSGSTYTTNTLPSGVALVSGSPDPSMTKYEYTAGVSIVGSSGNTLVQGNELSSLARGVYVIGGTDVTVEDNNIHDNSGDGIILAETNTDVVTNNTVNNSGENGIELSKATSNTIGGLGSGNTISGEDLNGIALLSNSNDNTISTNSLSGNGNVGTLNGAGIYINESSTNTFYNNNASNNVRGFAVSSSDSITSTDNVIGGTGVNQANTANDNSSSGILIQGNNTQGNTISGNTISSNDAYGIDNSDTHIAGATTPDAGDNTIDHNTISANILSGIRNYGASPAITNTNTLSGNTEYGIKNVVDYGSTTNPDTASDDILSEPIITGNVINSNHLYGVYSLDTAPTNKETLADDNTFDNGNEQGRVRQEWYGLVEALADGSTPEEGATVQVFGNGQNDALTQFTTASNGFGPSSSSLTDVETWQAIPEFEVSPSGTLQDFAPHRIFATGSAGTAIFAFDGSTKPASDFGNISGRYQVASVDLTQQPNTVSGKVFLDTDKNGSFDSGEAGAANITVTLYLSNDNTFGDDSVVGTPVTTGTDGAYTFTNIPQGKYFVTISVPSGYVATTSNPSNLITFAAEAQTETRDFGVAANPEVTANTGTVRGTIFEDKNSNGIFEGAETGVKNVTVKMYEDTNANKKYDEGVDSEVATSTSNTSGAYQFTNVPLGDYFLSLTVPAERTLTTHNNPTEVLALATDGQTITEDFGVTALPGTVVVPPTGTTKTPPPGGGGLNSITKFISGANTSSLGLIAPKTGAAATNSLVALAAVSLGLINLLAAVPVSAWPVAARLLLDGFTEPLLALFGTKKLPWGRLYDALSKKPVDLGLVRLYDAKSRILLGTAVTDRTGRFKFLPKPGLYTAKASKSGYSFPSSLLSAAPTYEKQNLYFGDQFKIDDMNQTFTKDIPLDPPQAAGDNKTIFKLRAKQTAHNVFAFGGITISVVNMILLFSLVTAGLFVLHLVLLLFFWRFAKPAKPKSWGTIYDQENKKPIAGAIVRIYDQKFGRLLDTAISDRNGKFGFLVGASSYYLTAEAKGFLFPGTAKSTKRDYIGGVVTVGEKDKSVAYDIPLKKMS